MKNIHQFAVMLLALVFLNSCGNKSIFEKSVKFGNEGWNRFTKLKFDFEIKDADIRYDLFIEAKVSETYSEQFLPFYMQASYSNGEIRAEKYAVKIKDNNNRFLNEPKDGVRFYSQCIQKGKQFPKSGKYVYEFEHGTSQLNLMGIEEISFKILKSDISN